MKAFGMNINDLFSKMESYAKENNVPIMEKEGISFLIDFIKTNKITSILEIGTAIGYSALKMSLVSDYIKTIERDEERYKKAVEYINLTDSKSKIDLVLADALDIEIKENYDLVFIDAAKAQNKRFLDKFKNNLNPNGYIIIDNINFHGLVGKSSEIESKNLRSLVKKIENFLVFLSEQEEFTVEKIEKGDGIVILKRL